MPKNYKIILIALLLLVYCFAFQGQRGLFEPDEGRYSTVSLQMIKSNDWIIPHTPSTVALQELGPIKAWKNYVFFQEISGSINLRN